MVYDQTIGLRYRFYGYLAAFVASIYGHRTGVLTNMTVQEVKEAEARRIPNDCGYVINVSTMSSQSLHLKAVFQNGINVPFHKT